MRRCGRIGAVSRTGTPRIGCRRGKILTRLRPSNRPAAARPQQLDDALGQIPYLHDTDRFLEQISDYDMTKPHTGARIMAESIASVLGEAGFSYLIRGLPAGNAIAAMQEAAQRGAASGAGRVAASQGEAAAGAVAAVARGGAESGAAAGGGRAGSEAASQAVAQTGTQAGAEAADQGRRYGGVARDVGEEVGPPPRHQPAASKYTDTEPPMYDPQGVKRYPHVDAPPPPTSIGEGIIPEQVWLAQMPPGTEIPAAITDKLHPLYLQQETHSCVLACSRMIAETHLGNSLTEESLRGIATAMPDPYVPGVGTVERRVQEVLWQSGVKSRFSSTASIDELMAATAQGNPAMVGLKGDHMVVVDGF